MLWRLRAFPDFCEPCLPSAVEQPPAGSDWVHEIKHDGFRLLARRGAAGVRLFTRNGHDWIERFPLIVEALSTLKVTTCLIDGRPSSATKPFRQKSLLARDSASRMVRSARFPLAFQAKTVICTSVISAVILTA